MWGFSSSEPALLAGSASSTKLTRGLAELRGRVVPALARVVLLRASRPSRLSRVATREG